MLSTNNAAIFRVATAYEAEKQTRTVVPDAAEATRDLGRERFYDAFAGRYGLPGNALDPNRVSSLPSTAQQSGNSLLAFARDQVLADTPSFDPASFFNLSSDTNSSLSNLIAEQEDQLTYLTENDADPKAIRGAKSVLGQLRQYQTEQALYAQIDAARDSREDGRKESSGFSFPNFLQSN